MTTTTHIEDITRAVSDAVADAISANSRDIGDIFVASSTAIAVGARVMRIAVGPMAAATSLRLIADEIERATQ